MIGKSTFPSFCRKIFRARILTSLRYITADSGPQPSLTRHREKFLLDLIKPKVCPSQHDARKNSIWFLARLVEASYLLDKVHTHVHSPTPEHTFNMEEVMLTVQTLYNLQTILLEEVSSDLRLYNSAWLVCNVLVTPLGESVVIEKALLTHT